MNPGALALVNTGGTTNAGNAGGHANAGNTGSPGAPAPDPNNPGNPGGAPAPTNAKGDPGAATAGELQQAPRQAPRQQAIRRLEVLRQEVQELAMLKEIPMQSWLGELQLEPVLPLRLEGLQRIRWSPDRWLRNRRRVQLTLEELLLMQRSGMTGGRNRRFNSRTRSWHAQHCRRSQRSYGWGSSNWMPSTRNGRILQQEALQQEIWRLEVLRQVVQQMVTRLEELQLEVQLLLLQPAQEPTTAGGADNPTARAVNDACHSWNSGQCWQLRDIESDGATAGSGC